MANLENTLKILFKAEGVQNVTNKAGKISSKLGAIDDAARNVAQPFANVFDWVVKIEAAVAAMASGSLAYSIKQAGDFESQFKEISTLFNTNAENLDTFRQSILEYSKDSTQSIEEINNAIYTAISAGTDYSDSLELIKQSEQLAVAGKADLNEVTKLLASTMNAYGKDMDEVQSVSDLFFQTVKEGQTTIPELSQSLAQVSATASGAGVPLEELTASVATLTGYGMPTSQAMSSIKQAISNIIKPTSQAQDVADQLGIEFGAATLKSDGFAAVLQRVYDATGGNAEQMSKLFGSVEGLNAAMALGSDQGGKFTNTLSSMESAAGSTDAAFEKMAEDLGLAWQRMRNSFDSAVIGLGTEFQDEASGMIDALGDIFDSLGTTIDSGALDPLIDLVEDALDDIATMMGNIAEELPEAFEDVDFTKFLEAVENVKTTIREVFNIDLSDAEGLREFLQTMSDSFAALLNVTSGMIEGLQGVWDALGQGVDAMSEVDSEQAKVFGEFLANMKIVAEGGVVLAGALKGIEKNLIELKPTIMFFVGAFETVWGALQTIASRISATILESISKAAKFLDMLTFGTTDMYEKISNETGKYADSAFETMQDSFDNTLDGFDKMKKAMTGGYNELDNKTQEHGKEVENNTGKYNEQSGKAGEIADKINKQNQESSKVFENINKSNITAEQLKAALENGATSLKNVGGELEVISRKEVNPKIKPDTTEVQSVLDDTPAEIKAKVDMVKARTQLEQVRNERLEKIVDLKIANVNAETERVKAAFQSIGDSFASVTDKMPSLVDSLLGADSLSDEFFIRDIIDEQLTIQKESFKLQKDLIKSQIDLYEQKARAMRSGEGLVKIDSTGLEPALEQVLWSIMEKVQMRISEEQSDFLLGCT